MNIKDLLTPEQYKEQLKEYREIFQNKEITFFEFCTNTYKLNKNKMKNLLQTLRPEVKTKLDLLNEEYPFTAEKIIFQLEATDNVFDLTFLTMSLMQKFLGVNLDDFYYIFEHDA